MMYSAASPKAAGPLNLRLLVLALAKLVECRDTETGTHLKRLQSYCRCLAEEAAQLPAFAETIDADFIRWLEWSAPLHDIGKAGIPDQILRKPGPLTPEERRVMQRHTILGAETLREVARQHGSSMAFLHVASDVARHHHERCDGTGYPDRLAGNAIPLAARLLAIADVYDALRSRRVYKGELPHAEAMRLMLEVSPSQFDPALLQAFQRRADAFDRIFTEWADEPAIRKPQ
jgi:HD-GYP domain-containing protein (c-di-GMP phosphodiesterase class II)